MFPGGAPTPSRAILVVDDDEATLHLVSTFLRRNNYRVVSASNPVHALELATAEVFNLVITDLMMPHVDGISLTQQLHELPGYKDVPVILMTAYGSDEVSELGLRSGVALTLHKPIELNRLLDLVGFATSEPPRG
jgi:CheY-like chemotaxis protein